MGSISQQGIHLSYVEHGMNVSGKRRETQETALRHGCGITAITESVGNYLGSGCNYACGSAPSEDKLPYV
jgi:hypothetical protein